MTEIGWTKKKHDALRKDLHIHRFGLADWCKRNGEDPPSDGAAHMAFYEINNALAQNLRDALDHIESQHRILDAAGFSEEAQSEGEFMNMIECGLPPKASRMIWELQQQIKEAGIVTEKRSGKAPCSADCCREYSALFTKVQNLVARNTELAMMREARPAPPSDGTPFKKGN